MARLWLCGLDEGRMAADGGGGGVVAFGGATAVNVGIASSRAERSYKPPASGRDDAVQEQGWFKRWRSRTIFVGLVLLSRGAGRYQGAPGHTSKLNGNGAPIL